MHETIMSIQQGIGVEKMVQGSSIALRSTFPVVVQRETLCRYPVFGVCMCQGPSGHRGHRAQGSEEAVE